MAELEIKNLTKEFWTPGKPLMVLDGIDLQLSRGQNLAVIGPSGCGKSTFLHIVGTLEQPTNGTISLEGVDPFQLNNQKLASFRNHQIGFVFQDHHLLPQLSAIENVLLPVLAEGRIDAAAAMKGRRLLEQVGLVDRADSRPAQLSGGERQRVAVARALIREPILLLADEPTGSLDEQNATAVGRLLLEIQSNTNTILICVTHSPALAEQFQTRVRLNSGHFEPA